MSKNTALVVVAAFIITVTATAKASSLASPSASSQVSLSAPSQPAGAPAVASPRTARQITLPPGVYSAIAYSGATGGGSIIGCTTLARVKLAALSVCKSQGFNDCKIVLVIANGAVALARSKDGHHDYGLGYGASVSDAMQLALRNCRKFNKTCAVNGVAPNCDGGETTYPSPGGCNGAYHIDPLNPNQCVPDSIPILMPGQTCDQTACVCSSGGHTLQPGEACR